MFRRNENGNEGTFAKTTLLRNHFYLGNGRNTLSLTEFWDKLGEFCEKLGEFALAHKIGREELTELSPQNSARTEKLTELGV